MKLCTRYLALFAVLAFAAIFPAGQSARGQSKDPMIGTWVLNLGKSDFVPDNAPQKRTMIFSVKDAGISCVIKTVISGGLDNGTMAFSDYTAKYDGKDYEISGSVLDTISLKRVDARTVERIGKAGGKPVETSTMKLSDDGKVLTVTTKGAVNGMNYSSTQVFDRQ